MCSTSVPRQPSLPTRVPSSQSPPETVPSSHNLASKQLHKNSTALDKYRRQHVPRGILPELPPDAPLTVNRV